MLARKYAQALYNATQAKGAKADIVATHFVELLKVRGQQKLLSSVLAEYRKISETASRRSRTVVRVAREKDARAAGTEIADILRALGIEEKPEKIVDESVIGGLRIESHGAIYDRTYRNHLVKLFREIVKQ